MIYKFTNIKIYYKWRWKGKGEYMPEISRFYGIIIKMFFKPKEHEPSHIHALYGEHIGILICGQ